MKRKLVNKSKPFALILVFCVIFLGFLIYDLKEPFVKPFFIRPINQECPYYKDFLGRVFYRSSYYPSSLFIIGPIQKKEQYYWHKVKGINYNNFSIVKIPSDDERLETCIASDGTNLIYRNYVFANADVESFHELNPSFYIDRNHVYYSNGNVIPGADPSTFELLTTDDCINTLPPYSTDSRRVYYANRVIPGVDRSTFELICYEGGVKGKDKNHTYFGDQIEN